MAITNLSAQLIELGIHQSLVESIAEDIEKKDARSLFSTLFYKGVWSLVADESDPSQLPRAGGLAVNRLLEAGVNVDDLVDVVRETQVDLINNIAQLLDWPAENACLSDDLEVQLSVAFSSMKANPLPLWELHSALMEHDPSGRYGEPRSLELRQLQKLSDNEKQEIIELIRSNQLSAAALKWRAHFNCELAVCLKTVQTLRHQVPSTRA
jgi:hypothetical protein